MTDDPVYLIAGGRTWPEALAYGLLRQTGPLFCTWGRDYNELAANWRACEAAAAASAINAGRLHREQTSALGR